MEVQLTNLEQLIAYSICNEKDETVTIQADYQGIHQCLNILSNQKIEILALCGQIEAVEDEIRDNISDQFSFNNKNKVICSIILCYNVSKLIISFVIQQSIDNFYFQIYNEYIRQMMKIFLDLTQNINICINRTIDLNYFINVQNSQDEQFQNIDIISKIPISFYSWQNIQAQEYSNYILLYSTQAISNDQIAQMEIQLESLIKQIIITQLEGNDYKPQQVEDHQFSSTFREIIIGFLKHIDNDIRNSLSKLKSDHQQNITSTNYYSTIIQGVKIQSNLFYFQKINDFKQNQPNFHQGEIKLQATRIIDKLNEISNQIWKLYLNIILDGIRKSSMLKFQCCRYNIQNQNDKFQNYKYQNDGNSNDNVCVTLDLCHNVIEFYDQNILSYDSKIVHYFVQKDQLFQIIILKFQNLFYVLKIVKDKCSVQQTLSFFQNAIFFFVQSQRKEQFDSLFAFNHPSNYFIKLTFKDDQILQETKSIKINKQLNFVNVSYNYQEQQFVFKGSDDNIYVWDGNQGQLELCNNRFQKQENSILFPFYVHYNKTTVEIYNTSYKKLVQLELAQANELLIDNHYNLYLLPKVKDIILSMKSKVLYMSKMKLLSSYFSWNPYNLIISTQENNQFQSLLNQIHQTVQNINIREKYHKYFQNFNDASYKITSIKTKTFPFQTVLYENLLKYKQLFYSRIASTLNLNNIISLKSDINKYQLISYLSAQVYYIDKVVILGIIGVEMTSTIHLLMNIFDIRYINSIHQELFQIVLIQLNSTVSILLFLLDCPKFDEPQSISQKQNYQFLLTICTQIIVFDTYNISEKLIFYISQIDQLEQRFKKQQNKCLIFLNMDSTLDITRDLLFEQAYKKLIKTNLQQKLQIIKIEKITINSMKVKEQFLKVIIDHDNLEQYLYDVYQLNQIILQNHTKEAIQNLFNIYRNEYLRAYQVFKNQNLLTQLFNFEKQDKNIDILNQKLKAIELQLETAQKYQNNLNDIKQIKYRDSLNRLFKQMDEYDNELEQIKLQQTYIKSEIKKIQQYNSQIRQQYNQGKSIIKDFEDILIEVDSDNNLDVCQKQYINNQIQEEYLQSSINNDQYEDIQLPKENLEISNPDLLLYFLKESLLKSQSRSLIKIKNQIQGQLSSLYSAFGVDQKCFQFSTNRYDYDEFMKDENLQFKFLSQFTQQLSEVFNVRYDQIKLLGFRKGSVIIDFQIYSSDGEVLNPQMEQFEEKKKFFEQICEGKLEVYNYFMTAYNNQDSTIDTQYQGRQIIGLSQEDFNSEFNAYWKEELPDYEERGPINGEYKYYFPKKCYGYGLNINKYGVNQDWIKQDGFSKNEWRILYHATNQKKIASIIQHSLQPIGPRQQYEQDVGRGIYFSDSIEICQDFSDPVEFGNDLYRVYFQCRCNPQAIKQTEDMKLKRYFLVNDSKDVRLYRIIIQKTSKSEEFYIPKQ